MSITELQYIYIYIYIYIYMILSGIENMYTVTASLHRTFYLVLHARHINIPMSLNGT
jgi:hypothetical protein